MTGIRIFRVCAVIIISVLAMGRVHADTSTRPACEPVTEKDSKEESLGKRLSCYNTELDNLSLLIGSLLKEREQLTSILDNTGPSDIEADSIQENANTIERLRLERADLSAQLHRQLIINKETLLTKESQEQLLRNYSQAYLEVTEKNAGLKVKVNSLHQQLEAQDQLAQALQAKNSALLSDVDNLRSEGQTYSASIAELSAINIDLRNDIDKRQITEKRLRTQLLENARATEELSVQNNMLQQRITELGNANAIANRDIAALNQAAEAYAGSQHSIKSDLFNDVEMLQSRLDETIAEKALLSDEADRTAVELNQQIAAQQAEIDSLKNEVTIEQNNTDQLSTRLKAQEQLVSDQKNSLASLYRQQEQHLRTIETLNAELRESGDLLAQARTDIDTSNSRAEANGEELAQTLRSLATTRDKLANTQTELTHTKSTLDKSEGTSLQLRAEVDALQGRSEALQAELEIANSELQAITQKRNTALASSNSLLDTNTALRQSLADTNAALKTAIANVESLDQDRLNASAEIAALNAKVASLEAVLDESQFNNEKFSASLQNIKIALKESNQRFNTKQSELQTLMAEKAQIMAALNKPKTDNEALAATISDKLRNLGLENFVSVKTLPDHSIGLKIASTQLFRRGSSIVSDAGQQLLANVAATLEAGGKRRILIEGHSDNLPLGPKLTRVFKNNMGLSLARAMSAANFLADNTDLPAERLSIAGAGDTRPIASNDTEAGRRQNRRVEIVLLPM